MARRTASAPWKIPLLHDRPHRGAVLRQAVDAVDARTSVHDFMHAKFVVADDVVFVGSFNLSRSGERNAENVLEIEMPAIADRLAPSSTRSARGTRGRRRRRLSSDEARPGGCRQVT